MTWHWQCWHLTGPGAQASFMLKELPGFNTWFRNSNPNNNTAPVKERPPIFRHWWQTKQLNVNKQSVTKCEQSVHKTENCKETSEKISSRKFSSWRRTDKKMDKRISVKILQQKSSILCKLCNHKIWTKSKYLSFFWHDAMYSNYLSTYLRSMNLPKLSLT